jgi:hypothetical protein
MSRAIAPRFRGLALAALVALWPGAPLAEARAPASSLIPPARPAPALVAPAPPSALPAPAAALPQVAEPTAPLTGGVSRSPFPRARPARSIAEVVATLAAPQTAAISPLAPRSSLRPRPRSAAAVARARAPAATPVVVTGRPAGPQGGGLCGVAGIEGRQLSPITSSVQGCGIAQPVSITRVNGLALTQASTVDCDTARAFERWLREAAVPAMQRHGGGIARVQVAAHYACRSRNNRPGARISEHGRGRAIDVSGFILANGERVNVLRNFRSGTYARALQQMHRSACGIFRTTLGPGSDRFHEDHFHYDLARHRGGGTYCR